MGILFFVACSEDSSHIVSTVSYRGWETCIKLSNSVASVIVNPTYGGQILYFGLDNKNENVLWTDSVINGWTIDDFIKTRRSPDSGRLDIGTERTTENIHDSIWAGPYKVYVKGNEIRLQSIASQTMGIQVEKMYRFEDTRPILHVKQRMTNISNRDVEYCFWTRTLLPSGGIYYCDAQPDSFYSLSFSEMSLRDDSLVPSDTVMQRIHLENNMFTAFPGGNIERRYGINTTTGTFSYQYKDYLYVIQNKYDSHGKYNCNRGVSFTNMIYFCDKFIEMEPLSPMVKLAPGESYEYEEVWSLFCVK